MQASVDTLEAQLAEKEQLVAALTERLEQAAEQLDRLHRTGADRALRAGFAGLPPELIEQQKKLVDDLQRAVQQWEEMQPGAFFGRLESQLTHIQQLVSQGDSSGGSRSMGFADAGFVGKSAYEVEETRRSPSDSPQSILAFMKASTQSEASSESAEPSPSVAAPISNSESPVDEVVVPPLQEPPGSIDTAAATADELRLACEHRDSYILYLLQRMRQVESRGYVPNSWAGLENMPSDLRLRLETLEKRLQEILRLAEVELSLQRAKLGREEQRIRSLDDQVQKELRQVRHATEANSESEARRGDEGGAKRWKRILGRRD